MRDEDRPSAWAANLRQAEALERLDPNFAKQVASDLASQGLDRSSAEREAVVMVCWLVWQLEQDRTPPYVWSTGRRGWCQ